MFEETKNKTLESFKEDTLEDIEKELEELIWNTIEIDTNKMEKVSIPIVV